MAKKKKVEHPLFKVLEIIKPTGLKLDELYALVYPDNGETEELLSSRLMLVSMGYLTNDFKVTEYGQKFLDQLLPYFKTQKKGKIVLDHAKIKEYNELFPELKLPSGKYARCSTPELCSAFDWFFKNYPDYDDWDIIFKATIVYLQEREAKNWEYTRRSKYFVRKQMLDKSFDSDLADYYGRILSGVQSPSVSDNNNSFEEKVV